MFGNELVRHRVLDRPAVLEATHYRTMDVDIDSLETLNLLTRDGAQEASDALEEMVDTKTTIEITKIMLADRRDVVSDVHDGNKKGVMFGIDGELSGTLLFTFDDSCIETVTEMLVPGEASESMAQSSITELSNIMMGGFMTGWGDHLETGLDATPPEYLESPDMDVFDIDAVGPDTESVLFFQSAVKWRDQTIGIDIYLIPDRASIETLLETESEDTDDSGSITEDAGSFGFNQASSGAESGPFASDDDGGPFAGGDDETGATQPDDAAGDDTATDTTAAADDDSGDDDGTDDADDSDPFGGDDDGGAFGFGQDDDDDDPIEFEELDDTEGSQSISLDKLSVFSDLTKEGTEAAADRVTTMTGIETEADIAGVSFTPVEDIPEHLEDGQYVGTTGGFEGKPSGHLVILFDEASAENIAEAMMPMEPEGDDGLTDMHESAIEELGNIMTSGFIDGWANVLQTSVEHTPPSFADDIEMAFMDIITEQLDTFQRHAFSVESSMQTDEMDFDCKIHAIPDESELGDALESLLVDRKDETEADPDELF